MKKKSDNLELDDELRSEYDLKELLKNGIRGKYTERLNEGTNLVLLEPDVAKAFPSAEVVNQALRLVMQLTRIQASSGTTTESA